MVAIQFPVPTSPVQSQPIFLVDASGNPLTGSNGLPITVLNATPLGQALKSASLPVALASDQSSPTSPLTVEKSTQSAGRAGMGFVISTGDLAVTVAAFQGVSLWNPLGSGKVVHVVRIMGLYGVTATHPTFFVYKETSDPSSGWTSPVAMTPVCTNLGSGNTSVLTVNRTATSFSATPAGTLLWTQDSAASTSTEILAPGVDQDFDIPPNSGLTVYANMISTSHYSLNFFLFEAVL